MGSAKKAFQLPFAHHLSSHPFQFSIHPQSLLGTYLCYATHESLNCIPSNNTMFFLNFLSSYFVGGLPVFPSRFCSVFLLNFAHISPLPICSLTYTRKRVAEGYPRRGYQRGEAFGRRLYRNAAPIFSTHLIRVYPPPFFLTRKWKAAATLLARTLFSRKASFWSKHVLGGIKVYW